MCLNTGWWSLPPLANSCVIVLLQSTSDFNQLLFKFIQIIDASVLYTLMCCMMPQSLVDWVQVGDIWWLHIISNEVGALALWQLMGVVDWRVISIC